MKAVSIDNDKILQQIINSIVKLVNPDKIILFGSRATGKAKNNSDYDVCVLKENGNMANLLDKIYRKGIDADAAVDVIVTTPKRFEQQKNKSYYVYYDIAKDGKIIYEKRK